jgi:hypothetical protein
MPHFPTADVVYGPRFTTLQHVRHHKETSRVNIFAGHTLWDYLEGLHHQLREDVHREDTHRLLNVNEAAYVAYLVQCYHVEPITLQWDHVSVSSHEEMIPAQHFPWDFSVHTGERYPKQVVTYHIPYSGEPQLFSLMPSTRIRWTTEVQLEQPALAGSPGE